MSSESLIRQFSNALLTVAVCVTAATLQADQWSGAMYHNSDGALAPLASDHISGELAFVDLAGFGGQPSIEAGTVANLTDGHPVVDDSLKVRTHDFAPAHLATTLIYEDTLFNFTPAVLREIRSFAGNETIDMWVWQNLQVEWKDSTGTWNDVNLPGAIVGGQIGAAFGQSEAWHMTPDAYSTGNPTVNNYDRSQIRIFPDVGDTELFGGATVHGLKFAYWQVSTEHFAFPGEPTGFAQNFLPSRDETGDLGEIHSNIYGTDLMEIDVIAAGPFAGADFNGNGIVDGADFLRWQRGFGAVNTPDPTGGDANLDWNIDGADLAIWETQYGGAVPLTGALGTVPEPSTMLLLGLGMSLCLCSRRKNTQQIYA